jgi:hypothetical protein
MLNQKGMATIEMIPILIIFLVLINFTLGFFGLIHSGILNSIAARNYAFETFSNRTDLNYIRDTGVSKADWAQSYYSKVGYRYHGVITEGAPSDGSGNSSWYVTERTIRFTDINTGIDNPQIQDSASRNRMVAQISDNGKASTVFSGQTVDEGNAGLSPVWVKTLYGICMNSQCKKR